MFSSRGGGFRLGECLEQEQQFGVATGALEVAESETMLQLEAERGGRRTYATFAANATQIQVFRTMPVKPVMKRAARAQAASWSIHRAMVRRSPAADPVMSQARLPDLAGRNGVPRSTPIPIVWMTVHEVRGMCAELSLTVWSEGRSSQPRLPNPNARTIDSRTTPTR